MWWGLEGLAVVRFLEVCPIYAGPSCDIAGLLPPIPGIFFGEILAAMKQIKKLISHQIIQPIKRKSLSSH